MQSAFPNECNWGNFKYENTGEALNDGWNLQNYFRVHNSNFIKIILKKTLKS